MRRVSKVLGITAGLVSLAAAPALAAVGPVVTVSGADPYATCTIGSPGTNFPDAEVEPSVAVNPANSSNVIGAWQQDRWSNGGAHGLVAGFSFDGGKTWAQSTMPFSECAGGLNYQRASDPWVSIGPDGTAYANAIVFDQTTPRNGVAAVTSKDGGKTWSTPAIVDAQSTSQFFDDKNSITANPVVAGTAYSVWDQLESPSANPDANLHAAAFRGPAMFSTTTDGGVSWSIPKAIFPTPSHQQTIGNQILVAPDGHTLYDFTNFITAPNSRTTRHDTIAFVKSTDGGATWSKPTTVADMNDVPVVDPNTGQAVRTGDIIPEAAIDPASGRLWVAWQDGAFSGGAHDDIAVITSGDGGTTWSSPARVNTPTGQPAFNPTIKVAAGGVAGVTYYDFRNLPAGDTTNLPTDYWFRSLTAGGGGVSLGTEQHVAGSFDMTAAPAAGGFFVGDYEGLGVSGGQFLPFFVQTTCAPGAACNLSNRTDVFATKVTP